MLPRVYTSSDGKYAQHNGKPKLSYSQYTSWKDPLYKYQYIRQYFMGIEEEPGIYAKFGSACGQYLEDLTVDGYWLTPDDLKVLDTIYRPDNAKYEGEIVIDRGWYVIQGFIDQEYETEAGLIVNDFKTGNEKKVSFYGGPEYQQTTLYSFAREQEGYEIAYSGVQLLCRKGDGNRYGRLRLEGGIKKIPTPYSAARATAALSDIDKVAKEISEYFKLFKKLNER